MNGHIMYLYILVILSPSSVSWLSSLPFFREALSCCYTSLPLVEVAKERLPQPLFGKIILNCIIHVSVRHNYKPSSESQSLSGRGSGMAREVWQFC